MVMVRSLLLNRFLNVQIFDKDDKRKSGIVLRLTPELRTLSLRHRTQLVYQADLGLIQMLLDCHEGQTMIETGTGSGSATVSFARSVGRRGKVHSFEFHKQRYELLKEEFQKLRLENVYLYNRDVYTAGFLSDSPPSLRARSADAAFLDLPSPWLAIGHADQALRDDARIVIFSPGSEQLQESALLLQKLKYHSLQAFEVLCKPWGAWTENDAARKAHRVLVAREANTKHEAGKSTKQKKDGKANAKADSNLESSPESKQETKMEPIIEPGSITAGKEVGSAVQSKPLSPVDESALLFPVPKTTFYQVASRGHTGYILVATKPPAGHTHLSQDPAEFQAVHRPLRSPKKAKVNE